MHHSGITSLTWDRRMFGWQLRLIASTSHFFWSRFGYGGVCDSVARGLPASLLFMVSSAGLSDPG